MFWKLEAWALSPFDVGQPYMDAAQLLITTMVECA